VRERGRRDERRGLIERGKSEGKRGTRGLHFSNGRGGCTRGRKKERRTTTCRRKESSPQGEGRLRGRKGSRAKKEGGRRDSKGILKQGSG